MDVDLRCYAFVPTRVRTEHVMSCNSRAGENKRRLVDSDWHLADHINLMEGDVETVKLSQRPCCVSYLDRDDAFLVGTYQLLSCKEDAVAKSGYLAEFNEEELESHLVKINWRLGSFVVIKQCEDLRFRVKYQFECHESGGVFDFVLANQVEASLDIYAAHSNGTLGLYRLEQLEGKLEISSENQQKVPQTNMLTCIDMFPSKHDRNDMIFVGSSEGLISVIKDAQVLLQEICNTKDPIWQVKCINLISDRKIVIVGTEISSWYIYEFSVLADTNPDLQLLYKSYLNDFTAGITCIVKLNCDIRIPYGKNCEAVKILVGSYDETLKCYQLTFSSDQQSAPSPQVELISSQRIADGGIWRIKQISSGQNRIERLYVAAMYAGSYRLYEQKVNSTNDYNLELAVLEKLVDLQSLNLDEKPLHYDIDYSPYSSACCIADFNNSMCLIKYDR